MRIVKTAALGVLVFVSSNSLSPGQVTGIQNPQDQIESANRLFREGKFSEAGALYAEVAKRQPENFDALVGLGRLALYKNDFDRAEQFLSRTLRLQPGSETPQALLAEAYYRRDKFRQAASLFRALGKTAMADKLQYLSDKSPYTIESSSDSTFVSFEQTDPLPTVKLRINGEDALFVIDTGGWELIMDTDLAAKVGAKKFGGQLATYAGGKQDSTFNGAVDEVRIGEFTVRNVPVHINNSMKGFAAMLGQPIRGVLGTVFLYHFVFTLDYPADGLILHLKKPEVVKNLKSQMASESSIVVPFWMSGDHIMVAEGTVNGSKPMLFFVDTGLAGGGFTGTDRTIKEAKIQLPEESMEGVGGGGKVKIKAANVDEITLGAARETNVTGIFGVDPGLEDKFGYRIGGIISHGFFRPYRLTFDFTSMNLILKRMPEE